MFIPDPDPDFYPSRIPDPQHGEQVADTQKKFSTGADPKHRQEKDQTVVTFAALIDVLSTVGAVESRWAVAGGGACHWVGVAARPRVTRVARTRVLQVAQQTGFPCITEG